MHCSQLQSSTYFPANKHGHLNLRFDVNITQTILILFFDFDGLNVSEGDSVTYKRGMLSLWRTINNGYDTMEKIRLQSSTIMCIYIYISMYK